MLAHVNLSLPWAQLGLSKRVLRALAGQVGRAERGQDVGPLALMPR